MEKDSLRTRLNYEPQPLRFGTSGRRGLVAHLTQLEVYLNALAELEYLQSLSPTDGGIVRGDEFYFALDLRPSSGRYVAEFQGRGEIAQAIEQAIRDAGLKPVHLGCLPTPALTHFAILHGKGSIMVTGSHIPFDRNGYKTNTARGELLKKDEAPINRRVEMVRERLYQQPFGESLFNANGQFKSGHRDLVPPLDEARQAYLQRYLRFFAGQTLRGKTLLVYQHSAVGRDLLVDLLEQFGARVLVTGRSEVFVPIDTENIEDSTMAAIQSMADAAMADGTRLDAVVSTDGDSDRPLLLGLEDNAAGQPRARFFSGDLLGMIVAEYLGADGVVVPISCNDAIDRGSLRAALEPKTRIGSPYVIAGMEEARQRGRQSVCGWEANGGFLTGSDIHKGERCLTALPTRDAFLPLLAALFASAQKNLTLSRLFSRLPARFSRAALLRDFPRGVSQRIVGRLSPPAAEFTEVEFGGLEMVARDANGQSLSVSGSQVEALRNLREILAHYFGGDRGFGSLAKINYVDGVRLYFDNGDVAHVRPSGNADELRIYAVADSPARADAIARMGIAEPDGLLRQLERWVAQD